MSIEFEIFWDDLTEEAQQRIQESAAKAGEEDFGNGNYDVCPLATICLGGDNEESDSNED